MSRRAIFGEKRKSSFALIDSSGSHDVVSEDKPRSSFHESDYHTPRQKLRGTLEQSKSRKYINIALLLVTFFVTSAIFAATLAVRLTGYRSSLPFVFTLGDTRLFQFNDIFCDQATLILNTGNTKASMFLLDEKPPQAISHFEFHAALTVGSSESNEYGVYDYSDDSKDSSSEYVVWRFYLYAGSVVELEACVTLGNGLQYIIVEGDSTFSRWKHDPENEQYYLYSYSIPGCASGLAPLTSFPFTNDENNNLYFFILYSANGQPSVDLTMVVNRMEYSVTSYTSLSNCTAEGKSNSFCTIDITYGNYTYTLIEVPLDSGSASLTYGDLINVEWVCNPRDWIYLIIFFVPFVVIMFIVGMVYIYCYCRASPKEKTDDREGLVTHYQTATLGPSLYSAYQPFSADPKTRTL